jgi:hypothetical protein
MIDAFTISGAALRDHVEGTRRRGGATVTPAPASRGPLYETLVRRRRRRRQRARSLPRSNGSSATACASCPAERHRRLAQRSRAARSSGDLISAGAPRRRRGSDAAARAASASAKMGHLGRLSLPARARYYHHSRSTLAPSRVLRMHRHASATLSRRRRSRTAISAAIVARHHRPRRIETRPRTYIGRRTPQRHHRAPLAQLLPARPHAAPGLRFAADARPRSRLRAIIPEPRPPPPQHRSHLTALHAASAARRAQARFRRPTRWCARRARSRRVPRARPLPSRSATGCASRRSPRSGRGADLSEILRARRHPRRHRRRQADSVASAGGPSRRARGAEIAPRQGVLMAAATREPSRPTPRSHRGLPRRRLPRQV